MVDEPRSSIANSSDSDKSRDAFRSAFGFDDATENRWLDIARAATTSTTALGKLGRYELLAEAGRGGQGIVYKARQPGTNRLIAIKRLAAGVHASDASRARFHREVSLVASLDHPGIVGVIGMEEVPGEVGSHELLLMEWVDGVAIDQWADTASRWRDMVPVFVQVCDAVAFAHQRGVMHRDLKPSNILVDSTGRARVLDFGLARPTGPSLTISRTTGFVGTPAYASPEAVGVSTPSLSAEFGRKGAGGLVGLQGIDTRSDIFSLGAVLYRLLTKREPFDSGRGIGPLFDAIRSSDPTSPRAINPELPRELEAIVLKALRKSPSERYQSMDAFASDLRRFLAGETVIAVAPSLGYQLRSLVRRHRAASVIAAAGLVGILLFAGAATLLAFTLAKERDALADAQVEIKQKSSEVEAALREALTKGEQHQSTSAFLTSLLSEIDNLQEGERAVTLKELLERASARLRAGELANQPGEEVGLLLTLSEAMRNIAQTDAALELAHEARIRAEKTFGPRSLEVMRSHHALGLAYETHRNPRMSLAYYTSFENLAMELLGPTDRLTMIATHNVGVALRSLNQYREALEYHCSAWTRRAEVFGENDESTISAEKNVAVSYRGIRDNRTAEALVRDALARAEAIHSPQLNTYALRLGYFLDATKRQKEAYPIYLAALERARSANPISKTDLIQTLNGAASAHLANGVPEIAIDLYAEVVALTSELFGEQHWYTPRARRNLARALCEAGRRDEGVGILLDDYSTFAAHNNSPDNLLFFELTDALATELRKAGQLGLALTFREEYVEAYTHLRGPLDRAVPRWETMAQEAREAANTDKHEYALTRALECEQASRARPSKLVDLCLSIAKIRTETGNTTGAADALTQAATFAGDDAHLRKRIADSLAQ